MERLIHKTEMPQIDMSHEARGSAVASVILSTVGLILMIVTLAVIHMQRATATFVAMFACACTAIGIIKGISGISAFKRAGEMDAKRPVASLVCGIVGVVTAGFSCLYFLLVVVAMIIE